jgi:hypothetical protein
MASTMEYLPYVTDVQHQHFSFMCVNTGENYDAKSESHLHMIMRLHRKKCERCKLAKLIHTDNHESRYKGGLKNNMHNAMQEYKKVLNTLSITLIGQDMDYVIANAN